MTIKLYPTDGSEPAVGVEAMVFKKPRNEKTIEIEKWKMFIEVIEDEG